MTEQGRALVVSCGCGRRTTDPSHDLLQPRQVAHESRGGAFRGPAPWKSSAAGPTSASPRRGTNGDDSSGDEPGATPAPGHEAAVTVREARGIDLKTRIGTASFAFRGYDVTNLGRSPELLEHRAFGPVVRQVLDEASAISAEAMGRPFDLAGRISRREESTLASFADDVATIVAIEAGATRSLEAVLRGRHESRPPEHRL